MSQSGPTVLVTDSGVGGLSVVRAIRAALPGVRIIYLADNAAFPYGKLASAVLVERLTRLAARMAADYGCDAMVVACNTASTVALDALREVLTIPVVGTVPAIKTAGAVSKTRVIGLLATEATVSGPYIQDLIAKFAADCEVVKIGSPDLAAIAEAYARGIPPDQTRLKAMLAPFFGPEAPAVDAVVLGCTHYPLLVDQLRAAGPDGVQWLDPSAAIADRLKTVLDDKHREHAAGSGDGALFTDPATDVEAVRAFYAKFGFSDLRCLETRETAS
jgi:glutamate racemase